MEGSTSDLSTEATVARFLFFGGAALAALLGLIMLGMLAMMLAALEQARPLGMVEWLFPWSIFMFFALAAVFGVILNLMAARRVRLNARQAGVMGIVAAFLPPTNLFSVAGAVLSMISPEGKRLARPSVEEATQGGPVEAGR